MRFLTLLLPVALIVLGAAAPAAGEGNEFEGRQVSKPIVDFRGTHELRTDPLPQTGYGYNHPLQVQLTNDLGAGADFLAIGTYNGYGTTSEYGPYFECADHYYKGWGIYTDGSTNGSYFCRSEGFDLYTVGDVVHFRIHFAQCNPYSTESGWKMNMGGTNWDCYTRDQQIGLSATAVLEANFESLPPANDYPDLNLDVKFRALEIKQPALTWQDFGNTGNVIHDDYYKQAPYSTQGFDAYQGTMQ